MLDISSSSCMKKKTGIRNLHLWTQKSRDGEDLAPCGDDCRPASEPIQQCSITMRLVIDRLGKIDFGV